MSEHLTDWTTARVVRDGENRLWGRDPWAPDDPHQRRWIQIGSAGWGGDGCYEDGMERRFGPLAPVLDADGQPVVHTVGDLTARHIGKRVRVEGGRDLQLDGITHRLRNVKLDISDGPQSGWLTCERDTPCDVLP